MRAAAAYPADRAVFLRKRVVNPSTAKKYLAAIRDFERCFHKPLKQPRTRASDMALERFLTHI